MQKKFLKFLFPTLLFALCFLKSVHADEVAASCRAASLKNSQLVVEVLYSSKEGGACHGFIIKNKEGRVVQKVEHAFLSRGEIWPSADGKTAVVLYERIFGNLQDQGEKLELYGSPSQKMNRDILERDTLEVLSFFKEGKKIAAYRFKDLVVRPKLVRQSVSHIRWVAKINPNSDGSLPDVLELETTSFRQYRFETLTGKMILGGDSPAWNRCRVIASGTPQPKGSLEYVLQNPDVVKGEAKSKIVFSASGVPISSSYQLLCFEERDGKLAATERLFPFVW